jgi:manganese-dependent inorganic pyrophosphatase
MSVIYVTGHRNPDTDSIASAIGYAELKRRLDPDSDYLPVRLGECNTQTRWVLARAEVEQPELLVHVMVRACDVMQTEFPRISEDEPVRAAGLELAHANMDLVPVLDHEGALIGVVTSRTLARRYVRESRAGSTLQDAPTFVRAIADVLEGELITGADRQLAGRVWVHSMDATDATGISEGDVVVVGNRRDAQRLVIGRGAALVVLSNGSRPDETVVALAQQHDAALIVSPLDTYVSGRMITLAAPCRALMEVEPLTAMGDDLLSDVSEQIRTVHYGAAIVIDADHRPIGLITRSDLVRPPRRRVVLVDHAEEAQSVIGVEHAEIVEILDHHHIGSIETRIPVRATFDPVGSTATLVVERFRQNGMEPSAKTALLLLCAILSDTVILNSPTTTERDRAVVRYLERALDLDGRELGREMFETTSDVSAVGAEEIISRDAKTYQTRGGGSICIAQIEVVGKGLLERAEELRAAMSRECSNRGLLLYALMITDVLSHGTDLLLAGEVPAAVRAFEADTTDGMIELPGVMSRKKQVAPRLLAAL